MKKIRAKGKRMLSVMLIISMLLPMLPEREVMADTVAAGEVSEDNTVANKEKLMENAGLVTKKSPDVKTEDGRNPLTGENDVAVSVNPSPELLVGKAGAYNAEERTQSVTQTVYELAGKNVFSDEDSRIVKEELADNSKNYDDEVVTAVRTAAFDPMGDGVDRYVAELTAVHSYTGGEDTGYNNTIPGTLIYLTVYDATKTKDFYDAKWNYSRQVCLGYLRFDIEEWQADAYMQAEPGDYDGDGMDELAVYCPTDQKKYGNDMSRANTCSYVTIYEVTREDDGTFYLEEGLQTEEGSSYEYYIDPARDSKHDDGNVAFVNEASEICAVDLEAIRHPGNTKDSLAIATSPARNGKAVTETKNAETQVDIWMDVTKKPEGANLSQHDMRWDLHTYNQKKKEGKEYDVMMFGGLSAGDLDGDGNDELVVAGYRVSNTSNTKKWGGG